LRKHICLLPRVARCVPRIGIINGPHNCLGKDAFKVDTRRTTYRNQCEKKGVGASALKIYVAMAMNANFKANSEYSNAGCTNISYQYIEETTDIPKSYIKKGIDLLCEMDLITKHPQTVGTIYMPTGYEEPGVGWAKLPAKYLYS